MWTRVCVWMSPCVDLNEVVGVDVPLSMRMRVWLDVEMRIDRNENLSFAETQTYAWSPHTTVVIEEGRQTNLFSIEGKRHDIHGRREV